MPYRFRKNSFLLLEVIIAFFLVVMCIIPLIAPHTFIFTEQKKFIHQIELDHVVNLSFADIVQRLYRNEISWNDIAEKRNLEIDDALLKRIKFEKPFPYKGIYSFREIKHKPASETAKRKLYLYSLELKFTPKNEDKKDKNGEIIGTLKYHYEIFLVRDLEGV